jgi:hypothetical protein
MSYPQVSADAALLEELEFFRLNTSLISPGDIYESVQSARAVAIGPDSDISRVNVAYFDETVASTLMNQIGLSPDRAVVSLLPARNNDTYMPVINPANDAENIRPGRILIYPAEFFDPSYRPQLAAAGDNVTFIAPFLDVLMFFKNPGAVTGRRVDKIFYFPEVPFDAGVGNTWLIVPYYGRKYGHISTLGEPGEPTTIQVLGINYLLGQNAPGAPGVAFETVLFAEAAISEVDATNVIVTAGNQGCFDAIVLKVSSATAGTPRVRMTFSDTPAATP